MANSKYGYVKSFEVDDRIVFPNLIVVQLKGYNFRRFLEIHDFKKPFDANHLLLMKSSAGSVLEEYRDIVFAYGFNDEYSFVLKKKTRLYQRRASKILSVITSFFTSMFVKNWKAFFPQTELKCPLSFHGHVVVCASIDVLQHYLAWRQYDCYITNQYDTCFWMLVNSGKSEREAQELLKGTQKQEKNEILFGQFGTNYNDLPGLFRWGSCVFLEEVENIVKYCENGTPVKRMRREAKAIHVDKISRRSFWNEKPILLMELGAFMEEVDKINSDYVTSFLVENKLMPSTWIVIRIDGCHFHRFSEIHVFEKPNDDQALKLMNSCAKALLEEFQDVTFAYGHSDEYSFVLKKNSQFCQRQASGIVSLVVSFFTSMYVMKWKEFFPHRELTYPPSFDGRAICYPSLEILHDYLTWRQVDCHINNQYNTCFWKLVKSGNDKAAAQRILKGTQTQDKMELLRVQFGVDYDAIKEIFRMGSSVFRVQESCVTGDDNGQSKVQVKHCNIIDRSFWEAHPHILNDQ